VTAVVATAAPSADRESSPGAVLAVLSLAAFMASLDLFIVNVAFPEIGRNFAGSSLSDLSWVLNGYAVLYAALLVPLGRLADRYGRMAGFLGGLALFTIASAACAASPNLWSLVAFRGLQAVGAAALTPTSLGLLLAATPAERRVRAVRSWAAIGALAAASGPFIGGLLVQASWRWVFIVNVPVGLLGLAAARRFVPDSRDATVTRIPDLLGALLIAVGIGALALGLVKGPNWGWSSSADVVAFVVAAVGIGGFWMRSCRHPLPVVEPALLRVRAFAWSNVTAVLFSVAFAGGLLAAVLWLQDVWHWSALRTGLAIAPGPLMVPVFAGVSQRIAHRVRVGHLAAIGCVAFAAGTALVAIRVGAHPSYAPDHHLGRDRRPSAGALGDRVSGRDDGAADRPRARRRPVRRRRRYASGFQRGAHGVPRRVVGERRRQPARRRDRARHDTSPDPSRSAPDPGPDAAGRD
jgi:EmrB/QacA subfamily drug resistance transporter